jgi:hypothetical protein
LMNNLNWFKFKDRKKNKRQKIRLKPLLEKELNMKGKKDFKEN